MPAYSLFEGATDDGRTVAELLTERGVLDVDIAGIATDYCVRASALDAIEHGRRVRILTDLVAGVAPASSDAALAELAHAGAELAEAGPDEPRLTRRGSSLGAGRGIRGREEKIEKRITRPGTRVIGVRMATVFAIAKATSRLEPAEIDRLLDSDLYEARLAAVSIMDFRVRERGVTDGAQGAARPVDAAHRPHRHVGLIDRSAPRVVGLWLIDKPRDELFELARCDWWHRRAAITATFLIIRSGDIDDALALCDMLAADPERFVQTNVGVALREIGRIDRARLEEFLARRGGDLSATRAAPRSAPGDERHRHNGCVRGGHEAAAAGPVGLEALLIKRWDRGDIEADRAGPRVARNS